MIPNEVKFGQLFVFGFAGKTIPDYIKALIADDNLGGIILFARNGETPEEVRYITESISDKSPLRPLVFVDQEGGSVSRINFDSFVDYSAEELGAKDDLDFFRELTLKKTRALIECGVDVNTVPVLDMPSGPDPDVLKGRCFGITPEKVMGFASVIYEVYRENNLLYCAKHFPGLGDTTVDPHINLPIDDSIPNRYFQHKLLPFQSAIEHEAPMIMTTHVVCRAFDIHSPVTFSKAIVDGMLKGEMGYNGLVVTDDLEMGAVVRNFSWEDATLDSVIAGHHFHLICHNQSRQSEALRIVEERIRKDTLFAGEVKRAVSKIEKFKYGYFGRKRSLAE